MKERIKKFMDHKGINAGELALALEVQRSNISHILNGRNKPGAAFIEKMLLVYPDLDARWLLTGAGNMLGESFEPKRQQLKPEISKPEEPIAVAPKKEDRKEESQPIQKKEEHNTNHDREPVRFTSDAVDKVLVLYKDGTFDTYKNRDQKIR